MLTTDNIDFHPVELTAHSLLSGSLDNLHDTFTQLHLSQSILLARLKHIDEKLKMVDEDINDTLEDLTTVKLRIRAVRRKLEASVATLAKVEQRVKAMEKA